MHPTVQHWLDQNCPVTRYAHEVDTGLIVAGPNVRLACKRHLDDLVNGPGRGLQWDLAAGMRAINFFPDVLRLADGVYAGEPFVLQLWQQFIVGSLFGWKGPDGFRRFRTAYIEIGKGNGKSPLAGGIGLYMLVADGEAGAEIYAAATKLEQAYILFRDAVRMCESSPLLSRKLTLHKNNIAYIQKHSFFRPVSSDKKGLDGPRPHGGLIDELHSHPDAVVVDKIRAGTKGRRQALIFEITNSGYDKTSVCWNHHEYSERILRKFEGEATYEENDTWFAYVCGLDPGDDWMKDRACWLKANPNLGISITEKYLEEQVNEAKGMPTKQSIVARLNFCEWVGAENPWISREAWESTLAQFKIDEMVGNPAWAALDLSARKDLTAIALVWRLRKPIGKVKYRAAVFFWTPKGTVEEREKRDKVPYTVWDGQKHLELTPGNTVDYALVARRLAQFDSKFDIEFCAFDPWRIEEFQKECDAEGVDIMLRPHGQGFRKVAGEGNENLWMPRALEQLEKMILEGELEILENPVLNWCSASAVCVTDSAGNRAFDKRKATGRIDGLVALAMGVSAATADADTGWSAYQYHDFVEIGG